MTDNTASNPAPEPQEQTSPDRSPMPAPMGVRPSQNWEVVQFPGQMAITESSMAEAPVTKSAAREPQKAAAVVATSASPAATSAPLHRTEELIQLIQDLNQCNDALLIRVSDLEETLERSQAALQAEIERNQSQGIVTAARSAAPPQIAQLLSELDAANDGLRRATIHNETLQTELESSQQRVAQLERECTLLQQRFSEKNTALQQAEDSCRDLKARLHRQQRYTLQFKTALEKCLNMANDAQPAGSSPAGLGLSGGEDNQPVTLPKAQEIQPWAVPSVATSHQSDVLSNLIHSLKPTAAASSAPAASPSVPDPPLSDLPEAWPQPAAEVPSPAAPSLPDPWLAPATSEADLAPTFTEPSPWGMPLTARSAPSPVETTAPPSREPIQNREPVADPLPSFSANPVAPRSIPKVEPAFAAPITPHPTSPAATASAGYPQRSQRKIASLAAVQLPSFGRPPRRS
jgi:hypothetical protein